MRRAPSCGYSSRARAPRSTKRWAMDISHVSCGADGWGHLVAAIDCHDRDMVGWEFALRGRAQAAERALEMAGLARVGTVRPTSATPVLRSDNGLVFLRRRFREAGMCSQLTQEYSTPDTPEQNGLIGRCFRSFKEACVWQQNVTSFEQAQRAVTAWLERYTSERPHQALGYLSPHAYRAKEKLPVSDPPNQSLRGGAANGPGRYVV